MLLCIEREKKRKKKENEIVLLQHPYFHNNAIPWKTKDVSIFSIQPVLKLKWFGLVFQNKKNQRKNKNCGKSCYKSGVNM